MPLGNRVEDNGGADARQGAEHLEHGAHQHAGIAGAAEDVARVVEDAVVQRQGGERPGEGDEVENAGNEGGLAHLVHRDLGVGGGGHVSSLPGCRARLAQWWVYEVRRGAAG